MTEATTPTFKFTPKAFEAELKDAKIEMVDPDILVLDQENERDYNSEDNKKHIADLEASIKVEGVRKPLHIDENNTVIDGNCRAMAAQRVKASKKTLTVPVLRVKRPTDPLVRAVSRVTFNNKTKPFSITELAKVVMRLVDAKIPQKDIAKTLGFSTSYISQLKSVASYPDWLKELVRSDRIAPTIGAFVLTDLGDWESVRTVIEHADTLAQQEATAKEDPSIKFEGVEEKVIIRSRHVDRAVKAFKTPSKNGTTQTEQATPPTEPTGQATPPTEPTGQAPTDQASILPPPSGGESTEVNIPPVPEKVKITFQYEVYANNFRSAFTEFNTQREKLAVRADLDPEVAAFLETCYKVVALQQNIILEVKK